MATMGHSAMSIKLGCPFATPEKPCRWKQTIPVRIESLPVDPEEPNVLPLSLVSGMLQSHVDAVMEHLMRAHFPEATAWQEQGGTVRAGSSAEAGQ